MRFLFYLLTNSNTCIFLKSEWSAFNTDYTVHIISRNKGLSNPDPCSGDLDLCRGNPGLCRCKPDSCWADLDPFRGDPDLACDSIWFLSLLRTARTRFRASLFMFLAISFWMPAGGFFFWLFLIAFYQAFLQASLYSADCKPFIALIYF